MRAVGRGRRPGGGRPGASWLARGVGALLALPFVVHACGGDGPTDPPGPVPGVLQVRLTAPGGVPAGAVQLEVTGPGIRSLAAAASLELFEGGSGAVRRLILVGSLQTGTVLTVQVSDLGQAAAYSARVIAVATGEYALEDPARYQAAVVEGP